MPLTTVAGAGVIWGVGTGGSLSAPLAIIIGLVIIVPMSLLLVSLRTEVTERELVISMRPLYGRRVPIREIDELEAVRYHPIAECGGWGIRGSRKYGRILNVSGNEGVRVVAGSRRYLIGSRRAEELAAAIEVAREAAGGAGGGADVAGPASVARP